EEVACAQKARSGIESFGDSYVVSLSHDFKWQGGGWKWAEGVAKATSRIIFTRQRSQLESGPNETDGIL
ncbi:MAG: hypothetical protein V3571_10515, partial [Pseudodesulfovibrio sp.]